MGNLSQYITDNNQGGGQALDKEVFRVNRRAAFEDIMKKRELENAAKLEELQDLEAAKNATFGKQTEVDTATPSTGPSANQYAAAASGASKIAESGGAGNVATSGLSGAAGGAMLATAMSSGAAAGPIGAAVGAGVGITGALLAQRAAAKKAKAEAEARKFENIAGIEQETETKRQNAMTNMVSALRSAFLRG